MFKVSNQDFIKAIFGADSPWCHVTDFTHDPSNIPKDQHLSAWRGNYNSQYVFTPKANQYFTISTFNADEQGKARRRKALYVQTHCVVLDDVREKLSEEVAQRLPTPSWVLETSSGSFQWGYILNEPCKQAFKIDNLNDGLIASDLAPDGKDPGQRGVTRYVRLPEGYNTKANRYINGEPFNCRLTQWNPDQKVTLEQLAAPFNINLNAERRETRVDGAASVEGHPLLDLVDIIRIKEVRSDGRFDITCPWVSEHTNAEDSGTAVFTNKDGTIGFKCHHGNCQDKTANDLLDLIELQFGGFRQQLNTFQTLQILADINPPVQVKFPYESYIAAGWTDKQLIDAGLIAAPVAVKFPYESYIAAGWTDKQLIDAGLIAAPVAVKFPYESYIAAGWTDKQLIDAGLIAAPVAVKFPYESYIAAGWTDKQLIDAGLIAAPVAATGGCVVQQLMDAIRREVPNSEQSVVVAGKLLEVVDKLPTIEQVRWHGELRDLMRWSKVEFNAILKDMRQSWYKAAKSEVNFFDNVIFIAEANQFYDSTKRIFYTPDSYQNAHCHLDPEARKEALTGGRVMKVDKLDYAPKMPPVFTEKGVVYGNSWSDVSELQGSYGAAEFWHDHFDVIGWGEHKKHLLQWMAHTLLHPDKKINHMITMGSKEGCGKDFLLYPLTKALGDNTTTISGDELLENFNDFLLGTKLLLVNETELGDHKDAQTLNARLKPLAAAPPERLRVNQKGVKKVEIRNILSVAMTTNSKLPFKLSGQSRRIFAVWSDLNTRDASGQMTQAWSDYWEHRWNWMYNGGFEHCIHYLRNEVDLSDFNPNKPPYVTEFLKEIQDASKSPQQQTVEAFVDEEVSFFGCDLVTVNDATTVLRNGEMLKPALMYSRGEWFSPTKVGSLLSNMPNVHKLNVYSDRRRFHVYCLRNYVKYSGMTPAELGVELNKQKSNKPVDPLALLG